MSGYSCFSTNITDSHDITEILLKVALNTITLECIHEHFINYFKRTEKIVTCVFPLKRKNNTK
jgi:hypothetical protein